MPPKQKDPPPPNAFNEVEIGILLVAIALIAIVTLAGTLDLSSLF